MSQASFQKQQREKARRERAAAKFARRVERSNKTEPAPVAPSRDPAIVLEELAELHARFDAGDIEFEDFEVSKRALTGELDVR
jgi:hypothetical protein